MFTVPLEVWVEGDINSVVHAVPARGCGAGARMMGSDSTTASGVNLMPKQAVADRRGSGAEPWQKYFC